MNVNHFRNKSCRLCGNSKLVSVLKLQSTPPANAFIKKENLLVSNSDILWQSKNKKDIINFARDINNVKNCKLLLSEERNFLGLKSSNGDFRIINNKVSRWTKGDEIIFYSGLQIVSPNIFKNTTNIFPMNTIWDNLIKQNHLIGEVIDSKITHIGDKKSFEEN